MIDREMIDQWFVIEFGQDEVRDASGNGELDAGCAVGFVYVDNQCGMTFNVEAWCHTLGDALQVISRPGDTTQRIVIRYDLFADKQKRMVTSSELAALELPAVPDWLSVYTEGAETLRAIRGLPLLDPFRAPGYPDDIKCLLWDNTDAKDGEWIWAKVLQQEDDDLFLCRLLNEPFQDFSVHEGEVIVVVISETEDEPVAVCLGKAT